MAKENTIVLANAAAPSIRPVASARTQSIAGLAAALWYQRGVAGLILGVGILLALFAVLTTHAKYTATAVVLMVAKPPEADSNPKISDTTTKPILSADLPSLVTTATVLERFARDLGEPTTSLDALRSRIHAKIYLDSSVLPIQYTAKTPQEAVRGANFLSDELTRFYREIAVKRFDSLIQDLTAQLATRRADLAQRDGELAAAAKLYPYIDVRSSEAAGEGGSSVYQRLIALHTERDELTAVVRADQASLLSTSTLVLNARPVAVRDLVQSDTVYEHLHDQYSQDMVNLKRLESFGNDQYPGLAELRDTVSREEQDAAAEQRKAASSELGSNAAYSAALDSQARAKGQLSSDQAKLTTLEGELEALDAQIGQGNAATNAARIRRDRDSAEADYETLGARLSKTIADRAEAGSTGSVVVIDRATFAQKATWTGGTILWISILVVALWLAITVAIVIDNSQERFRDAESIEALYGTPLLGALV
jgi:capsular polysaccharide biosynthesis protein